MSFYESPLDRPVDEVAPERERAPRRVDSFPVRFEEPLDRTRETNATRVPARAYPLPSSMRPTFGQQPERDQRQPYYDSEEDLDEATISRLRHGREARGRAALEGYEEPGPYVYRARDRTQGSPRASPSPSPPPAIRRRVVERVVEERRRERSTSPIRFVNTDRARTYSPVRTYGGERERTYLRPSSPYRSQLSRHRRGGLSSPTYRTSNRTGIEREDESENRGVSPSRMDGDDFDSQTYDFTLSRHIKSLIGTDSEFGSTSDLSEKGDGVESDIASKIAGYKVRHVLTSQYAGDGVMGGRHAVKITEAAESGAARKKLSTLFRWIHFEDANMDFDQFQTNAIAVSGLTASENGAITRLLAKVKKRHDKPMQTSRSAKSRYMTPSYLQETIPADTHSKSFTKAKTVSWMCVPYFCLENYTAPGSSTRLSDHPMRTLMQARFALVQKNRDMQQAYRLLNPKASGESCFHIAQLWFIVLDDSLLISCSRLSMSSLQGDVVTIAPKVSTGLAAGNSVSNNTYVIVSGKNSSVWSLPVSECQSWFELLAHFWEFWPRTPQFTYNDRALRAENWPKILSLANKSNIRLNVDFRSAYKEPMKGILLENHVVKDIESTLGNDREVRGPSGQTPPASHTPFGEKPSNVPSQADASFRVFTWPYGNGSERAISPDSQASEVYQDLKEIDDFLLRNTSLNDKLTYRGCPSKTREDVYLLITRKGKSIMGGDSSDQAQIKRKQYETSVDMLNAAESVFQFFLPPDLKAPTVEKFWGAVYRILEPPSKYPEPPMTVRRFEYSQETSEIFDWLKILSRTVVPFRESFSQCHEAEANIQVPPALSKAYLHLLMAMAFTSIDMQLFDESMALCNDLCEIGLREIVQNMSLKRLSEYATFVPSELASLVSYQMIQDVTGPAMDICETYWEYMKALQETIETNPLDRGHQDKIVFLKQEIEVISETLEQQSRVLGLAFPSSTTRTRLPDYESRERYPRLQRRTEGTVVINRTYDATTQPLPTFVAPIPQHTGPEPYGIQGLVAQDALAIVDGRVKDFREMKGQASDLASWNIQRIDSNKDRQEAAVYAFTVVTIIFLPLSTVATILGMNTNDVRNMEVNQWVFWATALPLTVLIVTLCLIWAGELNNFLSGMSKLWTKKPANYAALPETYVNRERDIYGEDDIFLRRAPSAGLVRRPRTIYGAEREREVDF